MQDIDGRAAGWVLGLASVLLILAMAHHPVGEGATPDQVAASIAKVGDLVRNVHGVLIGVVAAFLCALAVFARRLGLNKVPVLTALILYAIGIIFMVVAPLINGFVSPELAERAVATGPGGGELYRPALFFAFSTAVNATKLGIVFASAAILFWSVELLRRPGAARAAGFVGLAASLLPAFGILLGALMLDLQGFTVLLAVQGVWYLSASALLISRRV